MSANSISVIDVENHKPKLNAEFLNTLLLKEDLKDHFVVVISIAGAFRQGKSFVLNFFLRYLNKTYKLRDDNEWMGGKNEALRGFSWSGGTKRITTGILMWNEIFCTELEGGEKVAIILLDTQGTWDNNSTIEECTSIFALSTLLSSVQIYNVSSNIQRDHLENLSLFTEYGKLALSESQSTPFQRLQFLVRDWQYDYEYCYGSEGGKEFLLNKVLQPNDEDPSELAILKKNIHACFENIECFLMPDPGKKVKSEHNFNGRLCDIDGEFKQYLTNFVPSLLARDKLIIKKINGNKVKVHDFVRYFTTYVTLFEGDTLPVPQSIQSANAIIHHIEIVENCINQYILLMKTSTEDKYCDPITLQKYHFQHKNTIIDHFTNMRKLGAESLSNTYKQKLEMSLENSFKDIINSNEAKKPQTNWIKKTLVVGGTVVGGTVVAIILPEVVICALTYIPHAVIACGIYYVSAPYAARSLHNWWFKD